MTAGKTGLVVVAIDGPSGAGKSTVAKAVADRLGWRHLDTGSMYRAVTLHLLEGGVDLDDGRQVAASLDALDLRIGDSGRVWIGGREVTELLRRPDVEARVSDVSALAEVRGRMRRLQRAQAELGPLVAEGRDMASVVFPDARYKFFVDADPLERARRRREDCRRRGQDPSLDEVLAEIERRDRLDSTRANAPLVRVGAAVHLDTTATPIEDVVGEIVRAVTAERGA